VKLVEGDILECNDDAKGQSSRRMQQIWDEVRRSLEDKLRTYTLEKLAARIPDEMYYI